MNGIYFEIKKGEFRVVSTDGHRLVKIIRKNFSFDGDKLHMLVPVKTCQLMTRLFKGSAKAGTKDGDETENTESGDSNVTIHFSNEFLTSSSRNITISSRLIDDTFPNYESVIPTDNEKKLKVNKDNLISSVKRSIIMSDQITNRTSLQVNENQLKVFSANNEYGTDSEETIDCTYSEDEELEIAFNGKYLLEAIQQFETMK
jgi:DNA polymerase-3 subunit beta